ncbi:signal peptidase II [bacterium]|nr:signal peptidase II [bacterium]
MSYKRFLFFIGNMILVFVITYFLKMLILENCLNKVLTNTSGFISLVLVKNNGAAFNLFAGFNEILIIFAFVTIFAFMYYVLTYKFYISEKFLFLISAFCAGIAGNTYERLANDYVTDFIKINLFNFPVFNINDILITVGAILIVFILIKNKYNEIRDIKDVEEDDLYRGL